MPQIASLRERLRAGSIKFLSEPPIGSALQCCCGMELCTVGGCIGAPVVGCALFTGKEALVDGACMEPCCKANACEEVDAIGGGGDVGFCMFEPEEQVAIISPDDMTVDGSDMLLAREEELGINAELLEDVDEDNTELHH